MEYISDVTDPLGTNSTSLDMDLIDILWNQDIDMGVNRELYDPNYVEKELKQKELQEAKIADFKKQIAQQEALYYTIDDETGELIPKSNAAEPLTFQTQISNTLNKDLDELSAMINFDDIDIEKYLNTANDQSVTNYQQTPQQENVWSPFATENQFYQGPAEHAQPDTNMYINESATQNYTANTDVYGIRSYSNGDRSGCTEFSDSFYNTDNDDYKMVIPDHAVQEYSNCQRDFKPFIFSNSSAGSSQNGDLDELPGTPSYSDNSYEGSSSGDSCTKSERLRRKFCRDELKCKELKIPFTMEMITDYPVDEFNSLLRKHDLTEEQTNLIKDIRRRGKNKVAAQNCRKKKMHELTGLEDEINDLKRKREALARDKTILQNSLTDLETQMNQTYADVFNSLTDINGRPYDPRLYCLQISKDGELQIVPNNIQVSFTGYIPNNTAAYTLLDLSMKG